MTFETLVLSAHRYEILDHMLQEVPMFYRSPVMVYSDDMRQIAFTTRASVTHGASCAAEVHRSVR